MIFKCAIIKKTKERERQSRSKVVTMKNAMKAMLEEMLFNGYISDEYYISLERWSGESANVHVYYVDENDEWHVVCAYVMLVSHRGERFISDWAPNGSCLDKSLLEGVLRDLLNLPDPAGSYTTVKWSPKLGLRFEENPYYG